LAVQEAGAVGPRPNTGASSEVFNGMAGKVSGFVTVYKLFLRIRMRGDVVEEQIQWILFYV